MAEQFAFHQALRQRGAVDRHERPLGAPAQGVDMARDQLLARAGVADDERRGLAGRDLADTGQQARDSGSSNTKAVARMDRANALGSGKVSTVVFSVLSMENSYWSDPACGPCLSW